MKEIICGCGQSEKIAEEHDSPNYEGAREKPGRCFTQVEPGIYRDTKTGHLYERPTIAGKRTWRKLVGNSLEVSREEFYRRRTAVANGQDLYRETAEGTLAKPPEAAKTVGDVIRRYQNDGYPDKHLLSRPESTRASEEQHCHTLLPFWNSIAVRAVSTPVCDAYHDWRLVRRYRAAERRRNRNRAARSQLGPPARHDSVGAQECRMKPRGCDSGSVTLPAPGLVPGAANAITLRRFQGRSFRVPIHVNNSR